MRYTLKRDGEIVRTFDTLLDVWRYLQREHSFSVDWATKYEGYKIVEEKKE